MSGTARICSITNALAVVGERWSILALREIFFGQCRFDQIVAGTGASRDILTTRLRKLVDAGVVVRRQYEEHPPRYEYLLSESGEQIAPILLALMEWGNRYVTEGAAPTVFRHSCGAELHAVTVCGRCSRPIEPGDSTVVRLGEVTPA